MRKVCISCGMPMEQKKDFAMADETKDYCVHCARPDGSMRNYEEAVAGMTAFMVQSQGLDESAAKEMVVGLLSKLPAWNGQGKV